MNNQTKNLTEQIYQQVLQQILEGKYKPGEKLPPERVMTEITDASRITVRRAYERLEKNGIIVRNNRSGTCVAEKYRGNRNHNQFIAVLTTLRDPFARDFIEAVQDACNEEDILTVLSVTPENTTEEKNMAINMVTKGIRNLIVWGFDRSLDMEAFERMRIAGVNQVFFDRIMPGPFADFVGLDNAHAVKTLIEAALEDGARHLAFVDSSGLDVDSNRIRRDTASKQLAKRDMDCPVLELPWQSYSAEETRRTCEAFFKHFRQRKNAAILCVNDIIALRIKAFVPSGVKLYSIDGSREARRNGITSYAQPIAKMAHAAVGALLDQQHKGVKWKARKILVKGRLVEPVE
ncbi:MAG: GntR family transcriptional regulator [Candidatus Sumerlaeota bacterium]